MTYINDDTIFLRSNQPRKACQSEFVKIKSQSIDKSIQDVPSSLPLARPVLSTTTDQHTDDEHDTDSTDEIDHVHDLSFWLSQPSRPASPCFSPCEGPSASIRNGDSDATSSGYPGASRLLNSPVAPATGNWSPLEANYGIVTSPITEPPSPLPLRISSSNRDPYSWMTALQRDIMLYISEAGSLHSLYPSLHSQQNHSDNSDGVHVADIARAMRIQRHVSGEDFT